MTVYGSRLLDNTQSWLHSKPQVNRTELPIAISPQTLPDQHNEIQVIYHPSSWIYLWKWENKNSTRKHFVVHLEVQWTMSLIEPMINPRVINEKSVVSKNIEHLLSSIIQHSSHWYLVNFIQVYHFEIWFEVWSLFMILMFQLLCSTSRQEGGLFYCYSI